MYKRLIGAVLLMLLLIGGGALAEENHLLLIQDTEPGTTLQSCLDQIKRYAVYSNWSCDYASPWDEVDASAYDAFIVCIREGSQLSEQLAHDLRRNKKPVYLVGDGGLDQLLRVVEVEGTMVYQLQENTEGGTLLYQTGIRLPKRRGENVGGRLYVGTDSYPLCRKVGHVTHLAVYGGPEMDVFLVDTIQQWLWPYDNLPTSYGQYLVLDEVYPFTDPAHLMAISEMLEKENVPYALCVMPIYANAEYPSMKHFCEYLRYVQSRGAGIILHVPLVSLTFTDPEEVKEAITTAYSAYTRYGVYPMALEAPEAFATSEKGLTVLSGFRTVFLSESSVRLDDDAVSGNIAHRYGHQMIGPAIERGLTVTSACAQAVYLDIHQDVEALQTQIERMKTSTRVLRSMNDLDNSAYVGPDWISRTPAMGLVVNTTPVSLTYTPFEYEEFHYERGFVQTLTEQIELSNRFIMLFVLISCTIFVTGITLSRRLTRRQILSGEALQPTKPKLKKTKTTSDKEATP